MQLNLTEYLGSEGKSRTFPIRYEQDEIGLAGSKRVISSDADLELLVSNAGKGEVTVTCRGSVKVTVPCDRCLGDVDVELSLDMEDDISEKDITDPEPGESRAYLDGYELDTDKLIEDAVYIAMPMKILCKEDCRGLCSVCGKNLNEGECGCDRFVPDPRMAAIGDIFAAASKK